MTQLGSFWEKADTALSKGAFFVVNTNSTRVPNKFVAALTTFLTRDSLGSVVLSFPGPLLRYMGLSHSQATVCL